MEPSDPDALAKGLHALFTISNRWDAALPATQELYRRGVRYVLEHAKPPRAADEESLMQDLAAAKKACDEWGIRAGQLEKERDSFKSHNALLTQDIEGWKRQNEMLGKDRDEQKARADDAEAEASTQAHGANMLSEQLAEATARISALEKAVQAAVVAFDRWESCSTMQVLVYKSLIERFDIARKAALDAPQPKDSEPVSAGSSHLVASDVENTGQSLWRTGTRNPHTLYRDDKPAGLVIDPAHGAELVAAMQETAQLRKDVTTLFADLATLAQVLELSRPEQGVDRQWLRAIIQRGQARTPNNLWSNPAPTSPDVEQLKTSLTDLKLTPEQIEERREAAKERVRSFTESGHVRTQSVPWDVESVTGTKARSE